MIDFTMRQIDLHKLSGRALEERAMPPHTLVSPAPIAGHVGDGNFHCLIALDFNNAEEIKTVKSFSAALARCETLVELTRLKNRHPPQKSHLAGRHLHW
jgi:hypothetical protein